MTLYAKPLFVRTSGIGNKLFPFSRSLVFARSCGAKLLRPNWCQLRRGPLFRGGRVFGGVPLRHLTGKILLYNNFNLDLYQRSPEGHSYQFMDEADFDREAGGRKQDTVVTFFGDRNHFADLIGQHELIKEELLRTASSEAFNDYKTNRAKFQSSLTVILNVRLARDFRSAANVDDYRRLGAIRSPIAWYSDALKYVRRVYGEDAPAYVISDGQDEELGALLSERRTSRIRTKYAGIPAL